MKKIYMIPSVEVLLVAPATLIAESLPKDTEPVKPEEFEVKEQRQGDYNVWDDDWSR